MRKKILIVTNTNTILESKTLGKMGYGKAIRGLGKLTNNLKEFYDTPKTFNLILFTGGEDITPSFYNDASPCELCYSSVHRDRREKSIFKQAFHHKIPMIGICRGIQFLNVMAGGRLMHHMNGHDGTLHTLTGPRIKTPINVNSFHHQMVIPAKDSRVIGWAGNRLSNVYYGKNDEKESWLPLEVEAVIFPKINACGVQYHPEWMSHKSQGFSFFYNLAERLMCHKMEKLIAYYTTPIHTKKVQNASTKPTG